MKDIDRLAGIEGMLPFQQYQFLYPERSMKGPPRIIGHRLAIYLLRQAACNAEIRSPDKIDRGTARRTDKIVDRPQLLGELIKRLRILHPQVNSMGWKAAVIIERQVEAPVTAADPLDPPDQRAFHGLAGLECGHGDMRLVAGRRPHAVVA